MTLQASAISFHSGDNGRSPGRQQRWLGGDRGDHSPTGRELRRGQHVVEAHPLCRYGRRPWWIEHAAPEWEVNGEFLLPLRIADTAPSVYAGEASRVFDIEGGTYIEPQDGSPFPDTASWKTEQQVPG